jgi:CheY-like chemotaxis protein
MTQPQILVVDDEPDIRDLVREILEDEGYAVVVAENGEAARTSFASDAPDLVLLDIWMPDVDGITLLKEWSSGGQLDCATARWKQRLKRPASARTISCKNPFHWPGCFPSSARHWMRDEKPLNRRQPSARAAVSLLAAAL